MDDFPLPISEIMTDNTFGYGRMSFMDGFSGYLLQNSIWSLLLYNHALCLKNAGATNQHAMMMKVFEDMQHKMVECYIDDLAIKNKKKETHLEDLRKVFEQLRKFKLYINPLKCFFGVSSGKFLRFIEWKGGIELDSVEVKAIMDMPPFKNS